MIRMFLVAFSLLGSLFFYKVGPIAACSPALPDRWFNERLTLESPRATSGSANSPVVQPFVTVATFSDPPAGRVRRGRGAYSSSTVDTRSAVPFQLVMSERSDSEPAAQRPDPVPEGMVPVFRLEPDQSAALAIEAVSARNPTPTDINQQSFGRSSSVQPPSPQRIRLTVVHQDRLLTMPLLLGYVLNPNFKAATFTGCTDFQQELWLHTLAEVGVGLVTIGGLVYLGRKAGRLSAHHNQI